MTAIRQAFTPEALAKLSSMELRARAVVEGHYSGQHASAYRGASVEFVDHREYAPGDEPRHIDWRVYGRTDRLYVKQYEAETNLDLHLLLDVSRSMDFASGEVSKLRCATFVAAALAYIATNQRDAVGLFLVDHAVRRHLPAMTSPGHLARLFEVLEATDAGEDTRLTPALEEIAGRLRRRAIIVLLSDLLDEPEDVLRALGYFRHRGHDIIVLQCMDPAELKLAYRGTVAFEDLETSDRLSVEVANVRAAYLAELRRFLTIYRHGCRDRLIDYALLDTSVAFDTALTAYLARRRSHLMRRA
ncbi:MAG: DUF58 domain-containing protein [Armatimonadetes bacterium]|nr:DUF58 domain-containing protein [Armatimonadota bacterium]